MRGFATSGRASALAACIGLAALAAAAGAGAQQPGKAATPPPIGSLPGARAVQLLDRNGNGCVDLEEGRNYTSRRFAALDRNHDGVLDAQEAPPGPDETSNDRPITQAAWQDAYTARFREFDRNHDGCLSPEEIEAGRAAHAQGGR
jgi:hypothetical protein